MFHVQMQAHQPLEVKVRQLALQNQAHLQH